eukprot:11247370-Alexandrium_andersonii.AAC.1
MWSMRHICCATKTWSIRSLHHICCATKMWSMWNMWRGSLIPPPLDPQCETHCQQHGGNLIAP